MSLRLGLNSSPNWQMLTPLRRSSHMTGSSPWVTLLGTFFFVLNISRGWWQWAAWINTKYFKLYFWARIRKKQMPGWTCCSWMMDRASSAKGRLFFYGCFPSWFLQNCPFQVFHHSSTLSAKKPECLVNSTASFCVGRPPLTDPP